MNILLTGGLGYIGSHIAIALLESKHEIFIIDNLSNSSIETLEIIKDLASEDIPFKELDLRNYEELKNIFHENNFDAVIHLSGLKAVGDSTEQPLDYYDANVSSSINLFKCMKEYDVKKLVFSSSATVYGSPKYLPIDEIHPIDPINPYGRTKAHIEDILRDFQYSDNNLSIVCLRYFNPIGSHDSGLIGDNPSGVPNNLLPYILKVFNGELKTLKIFGDDYNTKDGTGIRDYIHINDLSSGHIKALEYLNSNKNVMDFFNLGTGTGISVFEVIKSFEKVSKSKITYQMHPRRPGDAESCYADPSKAKFFLNWEASFSLDDMTKSALKFILNNSNNK